ncbi:MAG: hypothetical protein ACTHZ9_08010 [Leucobacter sp.]
MTDPITLIDPDLPVCWESPEVLRIGFDRSTAVVANPSSAAQRLIEHLRGGIHTTQVEHVASSVGVTPEELQSLLKELDRALIVRNTPVPPPRTLPWEGTTQTVVSVYDDGRQLEGLHRALSASGFRLTGTPDGTQSPDIAVLVERYLEPLERAERVLSVGLPHLLIRFSDQSVKIGPLVIPPGAPCHSCLVFAEIDADPALPALASQLIHRVPQSETPVIIDLVGAIAVSYLRHMQQGTPGVHSHQLRIPVSRGHFAGAPELISVTPHPRCGCHGWGAEIHSRVAA